MLKLNGLNGSRRIAQKLLVRLQSTEDAADIQGIKITPRIERGPTDILKALASTVQRDPTAAHYKYHDDPFFTPISNYGKRTFALSQEAGRKAARWIKQQHAELFDHKTAEPIVMDFLPLAVYDENSKVSEEILHDAIRDARLADAVTIYRLLEKDGVSVKSKQALLELMCFCNQQEPVSDEFTEETWFKKSSQNMKPKWKSNELLETLFESLKNEDDATATAAYNALICGTAKYLQAPKAWDLFTQCRERGLPLYTGSFNSILKSVPMLKDSSQERQNLMLDLLKSMAQQKIQPNIGTLNAALQAATSLRAPNPGRDIALAIYKEFTSVGIEPSLGTYVYLLIIFCRAHGTRSEILIDILDRLEGKEFEVKDEQDLFFFLKAMDIASNHLGNIHVAHRIHKLLLTGNNYNLIGGNHVESIYYRLYLTLMVRTEPLDTFMALYDSLVPNIYIPESDVVGEILQAIEIAGASAASLLLPRLWSQMVMFDLTQRQPLLDFLLQIMHTSCSPPPESPVNKQYADIAWNIWTLIMGQKVETRLHFELTAELLGKVAILTIRGGYFNRTLEILSYLIEKEGTFTGILSKDYLEPILEACIENGHAAAAVNVVSYAVNTGLPEAGQMGYTVAHSLSLDSNEETKLVNLVGKDVLQLHLG